MKVVITPQAVKQFKRLSKVSQRKIKKRISLLSSKPLSGKKLIGSLVEIRSLRSWPYRILYFINKKKRIVYIVTIAHRQGVYK